MASPGARGGGLTPGDGGSELPRSIRAFYGAPRAEGCRRLRLIRASRAKGGLKMAAQRGFVAGVEWADPETSAPDDVKVS